MSALNRRAWHGDSSWRVPSPYVGRERGRWRSPPRLADAADTAWRLPMSAVSLRIPGQAEARHPRVVQVGDGPAGGRRSPRSTACSPRAPRSRSPSQVRAAVDDSTARFLLLGYSSTGRGGCAARARGRSPTTRRASESWRASAPRARARRPRRAGHSRIQGDAPRTQPSWRPMSQCTSTSAPGRRASCGRGIGERRPPG